MYENFLNLFVSINLNLLNFLLQGTTRMRCILLNFTGNTENLASVGHVEFKVRWKLKMIIDGRTLLSCRGCQVLNYEP